MTEAQVLVFAASRCGAARVGNSTSALTREFTPGRFASWAEFPAANENHSILEFPWLASQYLAVADKSWTSLLHCLLCLCLPFKLGSLNLNDRTANCLRFYTFFCTILYSVASSVQTIDVRHSFGRATEKKRDQEYDGGERLEEHFSKQLASRTGVTPNC